MTKRQKKKLIRRTAIKVRKLSPTVNDILIIEINPDEIRFSEAKPFLDATSQWRYSLSKWPSKCSIEIQRFAG